METAGGARDRLARAGEDLAARHLAALGFRILGRRLRVRIGEADLLAERGQLVVLVEVKTRSSRSRGRPADAVDRRKRERLVKVFEALLSSRPRLSEHARRIDVIEIVWPPGEAAELIHLEDVVEGSS